MRIPIEYYEAAAEKLRYEPETGKLYWRKKGRGRVSLRREAGSILPSGYLNVSISVEGKARSLLAHRVAWFIHHNEIPHYIDHTNNDRGDNRIENLRVATHHQNSWNSTPRKSSTSKYLGVYWNKKANKWISRITLYGRRRHLGTFLTEEQAALAYNEAATRLFGEFANLNQI